MYRPFAKWHDDEPIAKIKRNYLGLPNDVLDRSTDTLASVFPSRTRELIEELAADAETSSDMVAAAVLATSAIPIQLIYDVQCPHIGTKPTSLYCFAVLDSGLRKSTTLNSLTGEHKAFQDRQNAKADDDDSDVDAIVWQEKMRKLRKEIRKSADDKEALALLTKRMNNLKSEKPKAKKSGAGIMQKDITWPAMVKSLGEDAECTSWVHADASTFLPMLTRIAANLNELWDGVTLNRKRTTTDPVYESAPRGSIFWALQEGRFRTFVKNNGSDIVDVGLGARLLIVVCHEKDGPKESRHYEISRVARDRHNSILRSLFDRYEKMLDTGEITRTVLVLSEKAIEQWHATMDWIKSEGHSKGALRSIRSFGNRYMENAARVATILHVIEGCDGKEISVEILQHAILIISIFAREHERLFGYVDKPQYENDAEDVLNGLETLMIRLHRRGEYKGIFNVSDAKRNAHGGVELRNSDKRIRMALDHLADKMMITWSLQNQHNFFQISASVMNKWMAPSGLFVNV